MKDDSLMKTGWSGCSQPWFTSKMEWRRRWNIRNCGQCDRCRAWGNSSGDWCARNLGKLRRKRKSPGRLDYSPDWIVNSGCSKHMTWDESKLLSKSEYQGSRVVMTANNARLPISHIENAICRPWCSKDYAMLKNVYHVPGMEKNLLPLLYNRSQLEK